MLKTRKTTVIAARKSPRQARSNQLVEAILEAAVRVLRREGARRFTTARVAEEAGVSVGSLYQYFPNKEAILFRLQTDEWQQTGAMLARMLGDPTRPPLDRLRLAVHAFFHSECDEAQVRLALADAAPLYRETPEARLLKRSSARQTESFIKEVLPQTSAATRNMAADIVKTTLSAVGKTISERPLSRAEVDACAEATSDMLCAYLQKLANS